MAERRGRAPPELKDFQIGCSWIPATPAKPNLTTQLPICSNWQANGPGQPNWVEPGPYTPLALATKINLGEIGKLPADYVQITQRQTVPAWYSSPSDLTEISRHSNNCHSVNHNVLEETLSDFDNWQAGESANPCVYGGFSRWPHNFSTKDLEKSNIMSFQELLALADAGGNKAVIENVISDIGPRSEGGWLENVFGHTDYAAANRSSAFGFQPSIECGRYTTSNANLGVQGPVDFIGATFDDDLDLSRVHTGVSSVFTSPSFDLNTPAFNKSMSFELEPITPHKTNKVEYGQGSLVIDLSVDEVRTIKDAENNKIIDQISSTQLQETHKPDNGSTEEVDLTKTPQLKSRRKKHRPKVIIEGREKRTPDSSAKTPSDPQESTTTVKRKYVRRKGVTDSLGGEINVRRKRVNKREGDTSKDTTTKEVKASRVTRRSLIFNSNGQVGDESSSHCPCPSSYCDMKLQAEENKDQTVCTRGKCQIVFSDTTHDKETNTVQMRMNPNGQMSGPLTSERQVRGLKRQNEGTAAESDFGNRNYTGTYYNFMQAYGPSFWENADDNNNNGSPGLNFPTIYKKKRADTSERHGLGDFSSGQCQVANMLTSNFDIDRTRDSQKIYEDRLALGPTEMIRKFISEGHARLHDLASPREICRQLPASRSRAAIASSMGHLVADTRTVMKTKKRTKRSTVIDPTTQNLYNDQTIPIGPPLTLTWKIMSPVDSIMEQLNQLDLNADRKLTSERNRNAFLAYHTYYQEQNALVPFQRSGSLIPFDRSFDQVRRKRPRPKVDLDDETNRVWELLLENINSEGIDGTDEEKAKWWEEERRVFNGRADSFIARMHLVQGDRRFSPWKGSVVDSVVGVFLTQNVSDVLSSSAFMSMAARFPLKSKTQPPELHEEELGAEDVCDLNSDGTFRLDDNVLNHSISVDSVKEVNDIDTSGISSNVFIVKDELEGQSHIHGLALSRETSANKSISFIEDGRETEDTLSSSQNSSSSPIAQTSERSESCLLSNSEEGPTAGAAKPNRFKKNSVSFLKLLQMSETVLHGGYEQGSDRMNSDENRQFQSKSTALDFQNEGNLDKPIFRKPTLYDVSNSADISELSSGSASGTTFRKTTYVSKFSSTNAAPSNNDDGEINQKIAENRKGQVLSQSLFRENHKMHEVSKSPICDEILEHNNRSNKVDGPKSTGGRPKKEKENEIDWDDLRKQTHIGGTERAKTANTMDSVDWDAVRCADVSEIAQTIRERGMNNRLADRIKEFLDRLVRDHGSIDLEWLRDVPPDKAKEYLLSIRGLGLKSVECVRLLTLHHLAFPVDTNVGRIAVRLGWVPLQTLPESLQLHLLELYPVLESIQKYLWPRLCKLDQRTLYELHYQMITFGKVFCTKSKPNCNACPMRGECRHFASAFASARLALPAPEEKRIVSATGNRTADQNPGMRNMNTLQLDSPEANEMNFESGVSHSQPIIEEPPSPEPIVEVPATPEQDYSQVLQRDIEDAFNEDPDEIPTIHLNMEEFTHNLQKIMEQNSELQEGNMSKALVALTSAAASIPVPKLKNISRLRTEHQVYELPDTHPLLEGMERREPDDPSPYLLAIWTPGETTDSIEPPESRCCSQEIDKLCTDATCSSCNSIREANSQTVRGTILIPCRTAMRGSFPLNGTYFQVNEVFSDHESSLSPIDVPRRWLWNLSRRTVYFGTSIPTIFKGLSTEGIQYCFWRGFVCVRGFDRKTRSPRPLIARLHFPASRLTKRKGKPNES